MRAELLSVGTELLLGQIVDTNSAYLAARLAGLGIDCLHMTTVGDNLERATEAVRRAVGRSDLVVITGGLGPTEDDLTREAIAAAVGERTHVDPALARELEAWFTGRGQPMPERNRKQAWLIPSARALANPLGTAPGWSVEKDGRRIVAMPGVPREMTRMWEVEVEPTLFGGAVLRSRTLKVLGIGESAVEEVLGELVHSTAPTVATYAKNDGVHIRITDKGADADAVAARILAMERTVRERVGEHVWGTDDDTLAGVIAGRLRARGWRLAVAESLSAGELSAVLSADGGAFAGGIVRAGEPSTDALLALAAETGAEVLVATSSGDEPSVVVRTPERDRATRVRYRTPEEARRRAVLAALDLIRRALS